MLFILETGLQIFQLYALIRERGGYGIAVYNPNKNKIETKERLKEMSLDRRCDLITKAEFHVKSELYQSIRSRCVSILQKYEAEDFYNSLKVFCSEWSGRRVSNPQPSAWKADTLPIELLPQKSFIVSI